MEIANRRAEKIVGRLSDLISQAEEMKIDHGMSARSVRQWKTFFELNIAKIMKSRGWGLEMSEFPWEQNFL